MVEAGVAVHNAKNLLDSRLNKGIAMLDRFFGSLSYATSRLVSDLINLALRFLLMTGFVVFLLWLFNWLAS